MSLIKAWAPYFRSSVRTHGRAYQTQGRVQQVPPQPGEVVRAAVQGGREYTVIIKGEGPTASASCTCAFFQSGQYCKHIWAVLLDVHYNGMLGQRTGQAAGHAEALASDPPALAMPKARKRDPGAPKPKAQEAQWIGRLALLRPSLVEAGYDGHSLIGRQDPDRGGNGARGRGRPPASGGADLSVLPQALQTLKQICYLINVSLSTRMGRLVLDIKQRQPTRQGWGPLRPWRASEQALLELPDPLDRELIALILGGRRMAGLDGDHPDTAPRPAEALGLQTGAWRAMVKRLAQTGRLFLDEGDEDSAIGAIATTAVLTPVRWVGDEPWVLWLVGIDNGDGLAVSVELRRGEDHLPAAKPTLILGGPDGLAIERGRAAPLDDRDAFHWLRHFREDEVSHGHTQPIHVPSGDVASFLDRLYVLPALPEIEMPPGVGPVEQRLPPTPHLELFSPAVTESVLAPAAAGADAPAPTPPALHRPLGSPANGQRGRGPAAPLRGMLTARLWFAYADQHVKPGQPGRFLQGGIETVPPEAVPPEAESPEITPTPGDAEPPGPSNVEGFRAGSMADDHARMEIEPDAVPADAETLTDDAEPLRAGFDDDANPDPDADADPVPLIPPAVRPIILRRDLRAEEQAVALWVGLGFRPELTNGNSQDLLATLPVKRMPAAVETLLRRGWVITADRRLVHRPGTANLSIASGVDWFELRGGIRFQRADGTEEIVPLPQVLAAAKQGRTMITLGDGSQGLLPEQWLHEHGLLAAVGKVQGDALHFSRSQVVLLDTLLSQQELVDVDMAYATARRQLREFTGVAPLEPTQDFHGTLRPYQKDGLGWLAFLRQFGMGGILADDMGLGKTIQVLAMLAARAAQRKQPGPEEAPAGPTLVIAPRSVVFNWVDEAARFTPTLRVRAYTGAERQALLSDIENVDLLITTYGLVRRDIEELRRQPFDYVILDEAQAVKNPSAQAAKAVRLLQARHHLALTGTPVENHLGDLWSIFEFLNPGMLGHSSAFARLLKSPAPMDPGADINSDAEPLRAGSPDPTNDVTTTPVAADVEDLRADSAVADAEPLRAGSADGEIDLAAADTISLSVSQGLQSPQVARQLGQVLRPFILRRTKKQVLRDLPPKTEQTVYCEMEGPQKELYDQLLRHYRGSLLAQVDAQGLSHSTVMVLEALLRLRQAACHPGLIDPQQAGQPFAKVEALLERLEDIVEEGHKALVFSQFTSFLDLVRQQLDQRKITYEYLDGQTRQRKKHVERFQTDPSVPVFLISLKAGGLGLNLTAAEYVFILDPWWNPAVESQAIDRAHRIGQSRHVFAYRLICRGTVEERIAELQARKRDLAQAIVGEQESLLRSLTRQDLERLLS